MPLTPGQETVVCPNPSALARQAAERIVKACQLSIRLRNRFTIALAGGSTPKLTYELLAQPPFASQVDWSRAWIFFGDERCVPHDDERSNFRMADRTWLSPAKIDAGHIFPIPTDRSTPAECAAAYEQTLRSFFGDLEGLEFPQFDLILLGLGDDGHTASLFPGKPALDERSAWVAWSTPGTLPPPVDRITFTLPLLNSAREVLFLVGGAGKANIVSEVIGPAACPDNYPSGLVRPNHGKLIWMLDEAAAAKLPPESRGIAPHP